MATYTNNYSLIKPTYAETADIVPLNNNFEKIDEVMHSSQVSLAPAFDQAQAYSAGNVVMHELLMYEFTDSKAAGNWDATKVRRTTAAQTGSGSRTYGTASGQPASFPDGSDNPLEACNVDINPVQDLHGYSMPWAGGARKNKLRPPQNLPTTISGITFDIESDGRLKISGQATAEVFLWFNGGSGEILSDAISYVASIEGLGTTTGLEFQICERETSSSGLTYLFSRNADGTGTFTTHSNWYMRDARIHISNGTNISTPIYLKLMAEEGSTATTFEPYSNICPISARDEVNITVSATQGGSGEDTQISLGRNVYKGTLNVRTGELTVTHGVATIDGSGNVTSIANLGTNVRFWYAIGTGFETYPDNTEVYCNYISCAPRNAQYQADQTEFRPFTQEYPSSGWFKMPKSLIGTTATTIKQYLADNNIVIVAPLASPLTYTLTPAEVRSILGQNYIEADSGEILVVYIRDLNSCLADIIRRLEVLEQANSGNRSAGTLSLRGAAKTAPDETEEDQKAEEPQEVKEEPQEKPEEDPEEKQPEEEEESR